MNWVIWISLAILGASFETILNRKLLSKHGENTTYFFGYYLGAIFVCVFAFPTMVDQTLFSLKALLLIVSASFWFLHSFYGFLANKHAEAGMTVLIEQLQIPLVFLGGVLIYQEPTSIWKWIGLAVLTGGLMFLEETRSLKSHKGVLAQLASTFFLAAGILMDKKLLQFFSSNWIVLLGYIGPFLIGMGTHTRSFLKTFSYSISIRGGNVIAGMFSAFAYFCLLEALRLAPVSIVYPVFSTKILVVLLLGTFLLKEEQFFRKLFVSFLVLMAVVFMQW